MIWKVSSTAVLILLFCRRSNSNHVKPVEHECDIPDDILPPEPGPPPCNYDEHGAVENVAKHKPAEQSSNWHNRNASLAVDGNTDQYFNDGSCSHTAENLIQHPDEKYPWLVVDLGREHLIKYIVLYSRDNRCCADRYHDLQLRVGDVKESGLGNVFEKNPICNEIVGGGFPQGHIFNFTCGNCLVGRYVSVQIVRNCQHCNNPDYNILSICELEVYGYPVSN